MKFGLFLLLIFQSPSAFAADEDLRGLLRRYRVSKSQVDCSAYLHAVQRAGTLRFQKIGPAYPGWRVNKISREGNMAVLTEGRFEFTHFLTGETQVREFAHSLSGSFGMSSDLVGSRVVVGESIEQDRRKYLSRAVVADVVTGEVLATFSKGQLFGLKVLRLTESGGANLYWLAAVSGDRVALISYPVYSEKPPTILVFDIVKKKLRLRWHYRFKNHLALRTLAFHGENIRYFAQHDTPGQQESRASMGEITPIGAHSSLGKYQTDFSQMAFKSSLKNQDSLPATVEMMHPRGRPSTPGKHRLLSPFPLNDIGFASHVFDQRLVWMGDMNDNIRMRVYDVQGQIIFEGQPEFEGEKIMRIESVFVTPDGYLGIAATDETGDYQLHKSEFFVK